jgi:hypothetical protein
MISLGKYRTVMFNKDKTSYQTSVLSGIVTVFLFLILGSLMLYYVVVMFLRKEFYINYDSKKINAYTHGEGYNFNIQETLE